MTGPTTYYGRLLDRGRNSERLAALRRRWQERMQRFATVEVIAGVLVMSTWAALATVGLGSLIIVVVVVAISVWLHLAAVETGGHSMMWLATGLVLGFIVMTSGAVFGGLEPVSYTVAAMTALIHNELIRLSHARRRQANIDEQIYVNAAVGIGLVAVAAVVGIGLAQPLTRSTGRSWLWMPAASAVLIAVVAALMLVPGRKTKASSRQRWRPGDRIPPQPLGRSELE